MCSAMKTSCRGPFPIPLSSDPYLFDGVALDDRGIPAVLSMGDTVSHDCYHYQCEIPDMPLEAKIPTKACKDVFHAFMTRATELDAETGMPVMRRELAVPNGVIAFSDAMNNANRDFGCYVHFYEHDDHIERFWNSPRRCMARLGKYAGFISPDYSITPDMPKPQRAYNAYRNMLVGAWQQTLGYKAICNVRCSYFDDSMLAGAPKNGLIAIGAVGCIKNRNNRHRFEGGIIRIVDELEPSGLVIVGTDAYGVFEYPKRKGIPLYFYPGRTQKRFEELGYEQ
ncbi:DUF4417 domain-containing protein [Enorma phocaeensis]|uniref:DUF4417 domain-containing protein n=1 Tax=Enorma phocaeensis TaxID=1871019 RepID=UPI002356158F|nr:DUF4417 domain-containing protein [Enorma phocaeensis]